MQLLADRPLPPGLWLLKWIDRFSFEFGSQSAHVELLFEKLSIGEKEELLGMTTEDVQSVLARQADMSPIIENVRVQAAYLSKLFVGDVFESTMRIAQLRTASRSVRLHDPSKLLISDTSLPPPTGWTARNYRLLNPFEFNLPRGEVDAESRSLVFDWGETQYILPNVVVFRTFYGLHTRLIDAVLGQGWPNGAATLISTANYESGLQTAIDETGAWNIVLQMGIPEWMAAPLAFYWFDPYAREMLANVYTNQLKQNERIRGAAGRRWFMDADIPHPLGSGGLAMNVSGFPLRRFRRHPPQSPERFLITAITGHHWTPENQLICFERANSNAKGESHTVDKDAEEPAYNGFRAPVAGLEDALAVSSMEGAAGEPENLFSATGIETWPPYNLRRQEKRSSTSRPSALPLPSDGPSPIVSAGGITHRESAVARAVIIQRVRPIAGQFAFLIAALETLVSTDRIVAFNVIDAPMGQQEIRDGRSCWSLADAMSRWTFIKDQRVGDEKPTSRARAALALRIELHETTVVLVEIEEPNPRSGFLMYAWPALSLDVEADVEIVMDRLIRLKGRLKEADLAGTISVPITPIKHRYRDRAPDQADSANLDEVEGQLSKARLRIADGLREDLLHQGLLRANISGRALVKTPANRRR